MLKFRSISAVVLAGALATSSVFADETATEQTAQAPAAKDKTPGSGPNPFIDCGIGGALFPNTHWAAVTSNIIWDIGTTAVTSATMSPETCNAKQVETAQFIWDNYDNLAEETAKGAGMHLSALMNVMGCSPEAHSAVVESVRGSMATSISGDSYAEQTQLDKAAFYYQAATSAAQSSCAS